MCWMMYTYTLGTRLLAWHDFHFPLSVITIYMLVAFGLAAACRKALGRKDAVLSWSDMRRRVYPASVTAALDIGLSNLGIQRLHINIYTVSLQC